MAEHLSNKPTSAFDSNSQMTTANVHTRGLHQLGARSQMRETHVRFYEIEGSPQNDKFLGNDRQTQSERNFNIHKRVNRRNMDKRNFSKQEVSKEFYMFASSHGIPIMQAPTETFFTRAPLISGSIHGDLIPPSSKKAYNTILSVRSKLERYKMSKALAQAQEA